MQQQGKQANQQHSRDILVQPNLNTASAQQSILRELLVTKPTLGAREVSQPDILADIIRQVPSIRDFLSCKSKKAVLSCSKQCYSLMHTHVTAFRVNTLDDLEAISGSTWPSLGLIGIKQQMTEAVAKDAIARCKQQVLAVLGLRGHDGHHWLVLILKPSSYQHFQDCGIERQLQSLSKIMHAVRPWEDNTSWRLGRMKTFVLRHSQLDSASLARLLSLSWPNLKELDLSHTTLDAAAVLALAKGNWRYLWKLFLDCSLLNSKGIAELKQGLWPHLIYLHLRGAPSAVADDTLAALVAPWPSVRCLSLHGVQLDVTSCAALARTHNHLATLCLHSVTLDANKLSGLRLVSWGLTDLQVQNCKLGADAIAVLALCSLLKLNCLNLSHNQLDETAAKQLVVGKWPELRYLDVSFNALDNIAMVVLAKGSWPHLTWLQLQGNPVDAVGIAVIVKAWPGLVMLQPSCTVTSAET